jgi:hypothetical protein
MNTDQTILEKDLARELGLTQDELRELRRKHLGGGDFGPSKHGMWISQAGADRIRTALGVFEKKGGCELPLDGPASSPGMTEADFEKKGAAASGAATSAPAGAVTALWVKSCPMNRRLVLACLNRELTGDVMRVRVRSSENFTPRMEIKARLESGSLYRLEGRCPRTKGRF